MTRKDEDFIVTLTMNTSNVQKFITVLTAKVEILMGNITNTRKEFDREDPKGAPPSLNYMVPPTHGRGTNLHMPDLYLNTVDRGQNYV